MIRDAIACRVRTHPALAACRVALEHGPLTQDAHHWRYGRRRFSNATVKRLIEEGAAIRLGKTVVRAPATFGRSSPAAESPNVPR
jgi:hypothetical protein